MNPRIHRLKELMREVRELFPGSRYMTMTTGDNGKIQIMLQSFDAVNSYADATEFLRDLGISTRKKYVYDTYTQLSGTVDDVEVIVFPNEMPPTCRKVQIVERVPKTQTVDTGEFIEVTKTIIQCGEEKEVA